MKKARVILALLLGVLVVAGGYVYGMLPGLLAAAKDTIIKEAAKSLNGALTLDKVRLSGFMEVSLENILLRDENGSKFFSAPSVSVTINPFMLAAHYGDDPMKAISSVRVAKNSELFLILDKEGNWNIGDIIKPSDKKETPFYGIANLDGLKTRMSTPDGEMAFVLTGKVDAASNPRFALSLNAQQKESKIALKGIIDDAGKGNIQATSDDASLEAFAPLIAYYANIQGTRGHLRELRLAWENKGSGNLFSGEVKVADASGEYRYNDDNLHLLLDGNIKAKNNILDFSDMKASFNGQQVVFSGGLDLNGDVPLAKRLVITTAAFDPGEVVKASPWKGALAVQATIDGRLDKNMDNLYTQGQLSFRQGEASGIAFTGGRIPFALHDGQLVIENGQAGAFGGMLMLSGKYSSQDNSLAGNIGMSKLDIGKAFPGQGAYGVVDGQIMLSGEASLEKLALAGDIASGEVGYRALKIYDVKARAVRKDGKTTLEYFTGKSGGGSLMAAGVLEGAPLAVELAGNDLPISELLSVADLEGSGLLTLRARIGGELANPEAAATFYAKEGVVDLQPFKFVEGQVFLRDKLLTINKFIAEMNYGLHMAAGTVNFAKAGIGLNLEVTSKSVRLEPLGALLAPEEKITGNADNHILIGGTVNAPVFSGRVLMQEGSVRGQYVEQVRGGYSYSGDGLSLDSFNFTIMQMHIDLDGKMTPDGRLDFDFKGNNIRLENLPAPEEIKVTGGVDMRGHLSGNIDKPIFNGSISGKAVVVNGQTITDITGDAWSENLTNNYLRANFRQGKGEYKLDIALDYNERFAQGLLEIKNGDLQAMLSAAGQNVDVGGTLDGTMELNREGRRGLDMQACITNAHIRNVPIQIADVDLHLQQEKLTIRKLEAAQNLGRLAGRGTIDFKGDMDVEVGGQNLSPSLLTVFMEHPLEVGGNMSFLMQFSGATQRPVVSASMQISPGRVSNVIFDNLYGLFSVKEDIFHIDQLFIQKGEYKASAYGTAPVDLIRQKAQRKNPDAQMDVAVKLDNADLSIIPSIMGSSVEWGVGKTDGMVNIKGTLEAVRLFGDITVNDGTLKFKAMRNPLEKITLGVNFNGDKITLKQCSASMGAGTIQAEGSIGIGDLDDLDYGLSIKTDKLALASEMVTGPLTASFDIRPQTVRGTKRPLVKGDLSLDNITINLPVVPEFGEGGSNIGLDITVRAGNNTRLYNKYLYDMLLEGNLHITGSTVYTNIDGTVKVLRGSIKYLGTSFKIESASAAFPTPGSPLPNINLAARARVSNTDVFARINGPVTEMEMKLSSNPPLSQQEIFRLITLKTRTSNEGSSELTNEDMRGLLTAGLQMTFLGDVENYLRNSWGLDEFHIYQGKINSGFGAVIDSAHLAGASKEEREQYNVYVSKYITDRIMIGYTTSLDNSEQRYNMQYDINRHLSFSLGMDEDNKLYYGLEYRISF